MSAGLLLALAFGLHGVNALDGGGLRRLDRDGFCRLNRVVAVNRFKQSVGCFFLQLVVRPKSVAVM